ncbi:hypothetical protein [Vacuolonema iberomarrocanum]|nr:hypothetical protein [filamentous cyanobacterium LEGE 07170]
MDATALVRLPRFVQSKSAVYSLSAELPGDRTYLRNPNPSAIDSPLM